MTAPILILEMTVEAIAGVKATAIAVRVKTDTMTAATRQTLMVIRTLMGEEEMMGIRTVQAMMAVVERMITKTAQVMNLETKTNLDLNTHA
jgi:hypothetical protein